MNDKTKFGMFVIGVVALLQIIAWCFNFNGQVFAFTSLIIGLVTGVILDFKFHRPPMNEE